MARGNQALRGGAANISVPKHSILRNAVPIIERSAIDEQRTRLTLLGGLPEPLDPLRLIAVLKQQQAEGSLSVEMTAIRCALEPGLGGAEVEWNALSEPIRLAEIELRIRIASLGEGTPNGDRASIIGALPRIDPGLDRRRLKRRSGERDQRSGD